MNNGWVAVPSKAPSGGVEYHMMKMHGTPPPGFDPSKFAPPDPSKFPAPSAGAVGPPWLTAPFPPTFAPPNFPPGMHPPTAR